MTGVIKNICVCSRTYFPWCVMSCWRLITLTRGVISRKVNGSGKPLTCYHADCNQVLNVGDSVMSHRLGRKLAKARGVSGTEYYCPGCYDALWF